MLVLKRKCEESFGSCAGTLTLTWDERRKARGSFVTDHGEEARFELERGGRLGDGDFLASEDGRTVRVAARPEALIEARAAGRSLVAAAYHLGNRHAPVELGDGWIRTPADHVFAEMLVGLGAEVVAVEAPFAPEVGAYAHSHAPTEPAGVGGDAGHHTHDGEVGHTHAHDPFRYRPRIHRFIK